MPIRNGKSVSAASPPCHAVTLPPPAQVSATGSAKTSTVQMLIDTWLLNGASVIYIDLKSMSAERTRP